MHSFIFSDSSESPDAPRLKDKSQTHEKRADLSCIFPSRLWILSLSSFTAAANFSLTDFWFITHL